MWVKLDDGFCDHPKIAHLPDAAFRLHVRALCYCARYLTDGKIPDHLPWIPDDLESISDLSPLLLGSNPLWKYDKRCKSYRIHDFLKYNQSKAYVEGRRKKDRVRKESARNPRAPSRPVPSPETSLKKEKSRQRTAKAPSADAVSVAEYLAQRIREHSPDAKVNPERWARDICLAIRRDKRTPENLCHVIDFAHHDDPRGFWQSTLLSGEKLRKHYDTINAQIRRGGGNGQHLSPAQKRMKELGF